MSEQIENPLQYDRPKCLWRTKVKGLRNPVKDKVCQTGMVKVIYLPQNKGGISNTQKSRKI